MNEERFAYYNLADLLPGGGKLVLDRKCRVLTHLSPVAAACVIVEQCTLTKREAAVLWMLLETHPRHVPYVLALARVSGLPIEEARGLMLFASVHDAKDEVLRPVRATLKCCKRKLSAFGIGIAAALDTGYVFIPLVHQEVGA